MGINLDYLLHFVPGFESVLSELDTVHASLWDSEFCFADVDLHK